MTDSKVFAIELPEINLNQTADMRLIFLGIPSGQIDQTALFEQVAQNFSQFTGTMSVIWNLNYTCDFYPFPQNITDSLVANAFSSQGILYFNTSLLDELMFNVSEFAIPTHGYELTFMSMSNAPDHSWFYVPESPDLLLNLTTITPSGNYTGSTFPPNFGGIHRSIYYDMSTLMNQNPTGTNVTDKVAEFISNSLALVFPTSMGSLDPSFAAADSQTYSNYQVKILWINGTGEQLPLETIREEFESLMPWTNWTVTLQTRPAEEDLNNLVESLTVDFPTPSNYSNIFPNGSSINFEAKRGLTWLPGGDVQFAESYPLTTYFNSRLNDYFGVTDLNDKSVIPVVLLQLDNDTEIVGDGLGAGTSLFPDNLILTGFDGSYFTTMGELGPLTLEELLLHEIGHWLSLTHEYSTGPTQDQIGIIDPMSNIGFAVFAPSFCAFCRDSRARMSFISYYDQTVELLSQDETMASDLEGELNDSLQLFYDWNYSAAVENIASVYSSLTTPPSILAVWQTPLESSVYPENEVQVWTNVTANTSGLKSVILNYTIDNRTWNEVNMTNVEGITWNGVIPPYPLGTNVTYVIVAQNEFNNVTTSQTMGFQYGYTVTPEFPSVILTGITLTTLAAIVANKKTRLKLSIKRQHARFCSRVLPRRARVTRCVS